MQAVDIADYEAYQDYLEVHPEEFSELFNTILINVTSFFRDTDLGPPGKRDHTQDHSLQENG